MFVGRFPSVDIDGQRLDSEREGQPLTKCHKCFAFCEFRGDWSYYNLIFGLDSSWAAGANKSVCYLCQAFGKGDPATQYYHVDENAQFWGNMYGKAKFLAQEMPNHDVCNFAKLIEIKCSFLGVFDF